MTKRSRGKPPSRRPSPGLDDYIAKLADDRSYYLHWVHPAESTRRDSTSALVSASGSSPAPSTWCRDTGHIKSRPAPTAWPYGTSWTYPNGKNHWCDLGNGYEFNLQITPPTATQPGVTILSTGRKINNTADTRVVEAVVKQSSITDFQEIANDDISWGAERNVLRADLCERQHHLEQLGDDRVREQLCHRHRRSARDVDPARDGIRPGRLHLVHEPVLAAEPAHGADRLQRLPELVLGHRERSG